MDPPKKLDRIGGLSKKWIGSVGSPKKLDRIGRVPEKIGSAWFFVKSRLRGYATLIWHFLGEIYWKLTFHEKPIRSNFFGDSTDPIQFFWGPYRSDPFFLRVHRSDPKNYSNVPTADLNDDVLISSYNASLTSQSEALMHQIIKFNRSLIKMTS